MNTATRTAAKKETIWSTFGITTMALMTTMLIVSTYIKIPLPFSSASITAQTLVVNLIGMLFAPLQIVAIMVSWLLLSVMGIGGSLGKLLGPAGGYRYGNAVAAILIALFCRKVKNLKEQITAIELGQGVAAFNQFHQTCNHLQGHALAHTGTAENTKTATIMLKSNIHPESLELLM